MLRKGSVATPADVVTPEEEIKNPYVLEFLALKDEYSEGQVEQALIEHLGAFLLELGGDFAFVGRQRRLRIGDTWYRVDLLFFHRRLHCLILCAQKNAAVAHYALENLPNKILAAEYRMTLPEEKVIAAELKRTQLVFEERKLLRPKRRGRIVGGAHRGGGVGSSP